MANVFISYDHQSEAIVRTLAGDIGDLGHTVWFDQNLSGGQVWWDQILAQVRDCDVFVFALSPEALDSTACDREYHYADDLGKPILPILVADGIPTDLLPPALSRIHFADYREQDRGAAVRLARALNGVPPPKPLPNPLPDPPKVPISYLGTLTEKIGTTSTLSYEEQSTLVVDLRRALRNSETTDNAYALLGKLRQRRDLLAAIAEEIDELLTIARKASPVELGPKIPRNVVLETTHRGRAFRALIGFVSLGSFTVLAFILTSQLSTEQRSPFQEPSILAFCFVAGGMLGAITGAISGRSWKVVGIFIGAIVIGWGIGLWLDPRYEGTEFGILGGAFVGTVLCAIVKMLKVLD